MEEEPVLDVSEEDPSPVLDASDPEDVLLAVLEVPDPEEEPADVPDVVPVPAAEPVAAPDVPLEEALAVSVFILMLVKTAPLKYGLSFSRFKK